MNHDLMTRKTRKLEHDHMQKKHRHNHLDDSTNMNNTMPPKNITTAETSKTTSKPQKPHQPKWWFETSNTQTCVNLLVNLKVLIQFFTDDV